VIRRWGGFVDIFDDVNEDVEANDVRGAEVADLGSDGGAGAGVNFLTVMPSDCIGEER